MNKFEQVRSITWGTPPGCCGQTDRQADMTKTLPSCTKFLAVNTLCTLQPLNLLSDGLEVAKMDAEIVGVLQFVLLKEFQVVRTCEL